MSVTSRSSAYFFVRFAMAIVLRFSWVLCSLGRHHASPSRYLRWPLHTWSHWTSEQTEPLIQVWRYPLTGCSCGRSICGQSDLFPWLAYLLSKNVVAPWRGCLDCKWLDLSGRCNPVRLDAKEEQRFLPGTAISPLFRWDEHFNRPDCFFEWIDWPWKPWLDNQYQYKEMEATITQEQRDLFPVFDSEEDRGSSVFYPSEDEESLPDPWYLVIRTVPLHCTAKWM